MKIKRITDNKKKYMDLLLLADESEMMIEDGIQLVDMVYLKRER